MKLFRTKNSATMQQHHKPKSVDRRTFLEKLGFGSVITALVGFGYESFRSLIPNVLYETSLTFKIGLPSDLAEGMTFLEDKRTYVFKEGKSFYAISGACTHLGCTVKYVKLNQPKQIELEGEKKKIAFEFHCPCHGSKFYGEGTNFAGPAPRPLHWYKLDISPDDGQLIVNMSEEVERNFRLTV